MALPQRLFTLQEYAASSSYLPVCVETKACKKRAQKSQDGNTPYALRSFNAFTMAHMSFLCYP